MESRPFDLRGCRHDQSTYPGRVSHFKEVVNPALLFTSQDSLQKSLILLDRFGAGDAADVPAAELWEAKAVKDAVIHPATGEEMFLPGRMAAFVPTNTVVTAMMLMSRSPLGTIVSQW